MYKAKSLLVTLLHLVPYQNKDFVPSPIEIEILESGGGGGGGLF